MRMCMWMQIRGQRVGKVYSRRGLVYMLVHIVFCFREGIEGLGIIFGYQFQIPAFVFGSLDSWKHIYPWIGSKAIDRNLCICIWKSRIQ